MLRRTSASTRLAILTGSVAGILSAIAPSGRAQLYFDINSATAGAGTPGAATWDSGTNWTTDSTGSIATSGWSNGMAAVFSAGTEAAGTWNITLGGTIQTNSITFNGGTNNTVHNISGGTIDAGGSLLTLNASAAGAAANRSKTISSAIVGTGGVTIAANGDASAGSNTIFKLSGANTFTGGVTITSGVVGWDSNFGDLSNAITLNGGGIVGNVTGALSRNLTIGSAGGVLRTYGSATLTLSGSVAGSGAISRTDGGTAIFTGNLSGFSGAFNNDVATAIFETNSSPTGAVNVNAGTVVVGNNGTVGSLAGSSSIAIANHATNAVTLAVRRTDTVNASAILPSTITFAGVNSTLEYSPNTETAVLNLDRDLGSATTAGRLRIAGGTVNLVSGTDVVVNAVSLGLQSATNRGTLNIANGSTVTTSYFGIGESASNSGTVNQTGGSVTVTTAGNNFRVGHWDNGTNPGSAYNLNGGTLDTTAATSTISHDGTATMTVGGGAGTATWKVGALNFDAGGADTKVGQVIVSANGVVETNGTIGNSNDTAAGEGITLNGGTMKAMAANTWNPLIIANAATTSTIDTNGFAPVLTNNVTGTGAINLTGSGSLVLDPAGTRTIGAALTGTTPIVKNGTGTANLTGIGSYSGTMAANAGILAINGNYSSATVDVGATGAVGGEGTIGSIVMTTSGGALSIDANSTGALTSTNATFGTGSVVRLAVLPSTSDTFTVLNYTGTLTGFSDLVLQNAGNYRSSTLVNTGSSVTLNIDSKDLVWNGATGGEWNIKSSSRWNAGEADQFAWGDRVKFDESGTTTGITLTGELRPASLVVDSNTKNYTFTGSTGDFIGGTASILKSGTSTLTISAPNTYTGGTKISQGTIVLGDVSAMGTGAVTLGDANTGANNVALLWAPTANTTSIANAITVSADGTGTATVGTSNTTFANNTFSGPFALNRPTILTTGTTDRTNFNGVISGNVGTLTLNATNNGRVVFAGGAGNTFVGDVVINTGTTLQLGVVGAARDYIPDASSVTVNGAMNLSYTANGTETINALNGSGSVGINSGTTNKLIVGSANGSGDFSGVISGGANMGITKLGTGTQTLSGTANTYSAATTISGGTLRVASLANGGAPSSIGQSANAAANLIISGGALTLDGSAPSSTDRLFQVGVSTAGQTAEIGNNSANSANTLTFSNTGVLTYGTANQTRAFTLSGSNTGANIFTPVIGNNGTGVVTFNKTGAGKWILNGNNTYTGATTISGGTLQIGNGGATGQIGTGTVSLATGSTLTFNRTGPASIAGALNSAAGDAGTLNVDGGVALTLALSGNFSGAVNLLNGSSLIFAATNPTASSANPADFNLAANTTLTNTGASTHGHIGNVTLGGATWTTGSGTGNYDGENYQLNGNVTVTGSAPSTISREALRTDANSGVSLNGQRTFTVGNVTGNSAVDLTVSTQLEARDGGVVGGITKEGDGTMVLGAGPTHNYAGPTTVNAGTLLVNAVLSGSTTTVNGGTLGGIGTLAATTIGADGTLSPGLSIGTLKFSSTLALAGTVNIEISKVGPALSSDLVNVTGLLTLGGTLNVAASGDSLAFGDSFNLFDAGSFSGTFATLSLPTLGTGLSWDTSGLPITGSIAVVPEPNTAIAMIGGIGLLLGLRRRRA